MEKKFINMPSIGIIFKEYKRFNDIECFKERQTLFSKLYKIKIWYGSISKENSGKSILGIECEYKLLDGKVIKGKSYKGQIGKDDVDTKELELKSNDFFYKGFINYDDYSITYIELESFKGEKIQMGSKLSSTEKSFNAEGEPLVIQYVYGFYDENCIRALGFRYAPKIYILILNIIDILRVRHKFKTNIKEKEYWSNEDNLKKLNLVMKAVAKLALLSDSPFSCVFKFLLG